MEYGQGHKISDLHENGDSLISNFLILEIKDLHKATGPKTSVRLVDGEQEYTINCFDAINIVMSKIQEEKVFQLKIVKKAGSNGGLFTNIDFSYQPREQIEISITNFAITATTDGERLYKEILEMIKSTNPNARGNNLADIAIVLYERYKERLIKWTAAKGNHHVGIGGLMLHTHRMVMIADSYTHFYPELDRELIICGAALHDIGKLDEYDMDMLGNSKVTSTYVLLGHLLTGAMLVEETAKQLGCDRERVMLLEHLIASHHGKAEYGAIKGAAIPEAVLLAHIDDADAKLNEFKTMYETELKNSGMISSRKYGSDYPNFVYRPE